MKKYLIAITTAVMVLMLAACGSSSGTPKGGETEGSPQEQTEKAEGSSQEQTGEAEGSSQEMTEKTEAESTKGTEETVHPYAWLGLQDMPECDYLNILATNHYYKKSEMYIEGMSHVSEEINAVDGINTYKESGGTKVYSIDGMVTSVNEDGKYYIEQDATDLAETAKENYEEATKNGTNLYGRSFAGKGSEAVPVYSGQTDDKDEYEYYEYNYPEMEASGDNSYIERYYMKDGDVFAIYNKTVWGDTVVESTEIIKKMTGDIPEGTFDLPDLSGFEKME